MQHHQMAHLISKTQHKHLAYYKDHLWTSPLHQQVHILCVCMCYWHMLSNEATPSGSIRDRLIRLIS